MMEPNRRWYWYWEWLLADKISSKGFAAGNIYKDFYPNYVVLIGSFLVKYLWPENIPSCPPDPNILSPDVSSHNSVWRVLLLPPFNPESWTQGIGDGLPTYLALSSNLKTTMNCTIYPSFNPSFVPFFASSHSFLCSFHIQINSLSCPHSPLPSCAVGNCTLLFVVQFTCLFSMTMEGVVQWTSGAFNAIRLLIY